MKIELKMEEKVNDIYIKLGSPYPLQNQCKIGGGRFLEQCHM